ncbi:hypothetical protein BDV25DRAFT_171878 [Aspergillus avenaceus]|uniref:BZIP domain-containing protein n=1 Tax=Aspergillus avenaceus TaxID=36643 RepID=A0A5N6TX19_ASPAV|nr:hypothetical protein BDV25DRAFT_171878 [Aspergillus avenaceus]
MDSSYRILSPADRKRIRDRRHQQAFQRVESCEQGHDSEGIQRILEMNHVLRAQNEALLAREATLKRMFKSWENGSIPSSPAGTGYSRLGRRGDISSSPALNRMPTPILASDTMSVAPRLQPQMSWNMLPLHEAFSYPESCHWFAYPNLVLSSADTPSPLDLLYGSRSNALADMIYTSMKGELFRDPERLALSWILYHFSRWYMSPSPAAYERIPTFARPMPEQLHTMHPRVLDCAFVVPEMRLNLIRRWHQYQGRHQELIGLLACCWRVRWPWGEPILERNAYNEICIRPSFYNTFMNEKGWGLTPEFIERFPEPLSGIDVDSIINAIG